MRAVQALKEQIQILKNENASLRAKVAFFENHPTIAQGIKGERIIAKIVPGDLTTHNQSFDFAASRRSLKLEIKFSRLNNAVRRIKTKPTFRWAWAKPLGESGQKVFDRLILVGEKNAEHKDLYLDKNSPYVFFDIPYKEILSLTIRTNSGRYRSIQLTSNPKTAKSTAAVLFRKYQTNAEELRKKYRI